MYTFQKQWVRVIFVMYESTKNTGKLGNVNLV